MFQKFFSQVKNAIKVISISLVIAAFLVPAPVYALEQCQAVDPRIPNFGLNCIPFFQNLQGTREGISGIILNVADYAIYIIAAISVIMIIYAGLLFVLDGGSGEKSGKARKIIINVIIGIVIALLSYTIVSVVSSVVNNIGTDF